MNRKVSPPVILAFPSGGPDARAASPAGRAGARLARFHRLRCVADDTADDVTDEALAAMRARLLRMIIDNERVRIDGPRAS